jgi:hypothetical protein
MRVFFDLIFKETEKGSSSFTSFAYICVKSLIIDDQGNSMIFTPETTESEVDSKIDRLIKDLESIRREIKSKFIDHKK